MKQKIRSFADLAALQGAMQTRIPEAAARTAERGARLFSERARAAFDAGQTPDGRPFGASHRDGKPLKMKKTGALEAAATDYQAHGSTIRASVLSVPYGKYQLRHGILPTSLPAVWGAELAAIAKEEIAATLRLQ